MPAATLSPASTPPQSQDARILATAAEHVRRHGIARTTVVSVAREAGMTHANVYRYFPSKAALADAVTADWLKPLEAELAQVADAPDPADDKLERMLMAIASTQRDKLEADPNLFDLYVSAHEENRVVSRKHRQRVRMLVERVIEEGVGAEVFTLRRPEKGVTLVLDAVFRFTHPPAVRLDKDIPRRVLDDRLSTAVKLVLRGLKGGIA